MRQGLLALAASEVPFPFGVEGRERSLDLAAPWLQRVIKKTGTRPWVRAFIMPNRMGQTGRLLEQLCRHDAIL